MTNPVISLLQNRRTIYAIGKNIQQTPEQLTELIQEAIRQSPSSFNSQSSRAVILFDAEHEKFWGFVKEKLKEYATDDAAAEKTKKMDSFAAGVGTILFLKIKMSFRSFKRSLPCMQIIFRFGPSIRLLWRNLQYGQHLQLKMWGHLYSTIILSSMTKSMLNGLFHRVETTCTIGVWFN